MFNRKKDSGKRDEDIAMRIVHAGQVRDVSFRELLLSTNVTMEALLSLLAKKGMISPDEMIEEISSIQKRHAEASRRKKDKGQKEGVE
ncbi:hypothetical protein JW979_03585 [bacterium]|nr:hypothetical protein [candidate division CSSED10-310 bacterium]